MKNEYGAKLDANGYAPSIMQSCEDACYICFSGRDLVRHEPIGGPYRAKSKRLGLWVHLCTCCHEKVHSASMMGIRQGRMMKSDAQIVAEWYYHWNDERFIEEFGKNYKE